MIMRRSLAPTTVYLIMRGINSFAFALVLTYELAYHTVVVGLTPFQLVLAGVVLESMTFLFEIPTGLIADLYSRRFSVILGILLTGCGFLIETLAPVFAAVLIAQIVWGIGFTFYSGAEAAWISDEIGTERAHAVFLQATQIGQLPAIVGTLLGAALSQISISFPVILGAILFVLLGGGLCLIMPEAGFRPMARDQQHTRAHLLQPLLASVRLVRIHPILWMILLLGIIIGMCLGGFDRLYTPHLLYNVKLPQIGDITPVAWLGILNGAVTIGSLIGTEIVRRNYRTSDQRVMMQLLMVLYSGMIIGSFVFALTGMFILAIIGFCLTQSLRNISRPLLLIWVNQNAPQQSRATVISMYWQSNAFGQIIGSPLLGWVGTVASLPLALAIGTGVYTATLPLLLFARNRWNRAEQNNPN